MDGDAPTAASISIQRSVPATVATATAKPTIVSGHDDSHRSVDSSTMTASQLLAQAQADHLAAEEERLRPVAEYEGLPDRYVLTEKLGDGTFSVVFKAFDRKTGATVAVKVVRKSNEHGDTALDPSIREQNRATDRKTILQEVQIMRRLRHDSIVQLVDFIEWDEYCFLVLELLDGGELFDQIVKLTYMSEPLSRHIIYQVAKGIQYMHEECGIVHRDIKPENLLFEKIDFIPSANEVKRPYDEDKEDEGEFIPGVGGGGIGRVKIADFGLSKIVWTESTKTPCGTVGYAAPEIVRDEHYSHSVDMWALGCVLYTLLCGFPPFYDESIKTLSDKVSRGQYSFLSPWWDDISDMAKDLVSKLLCVDVTKRLTIRDFFEHPWIKAGAVPDSEAGRAPFQAAFTPGASTTKKEWLGDFNSIADSPLLASLQVGEYADEGRRHVNKNYLREAFDVSFAVHRIEEESRQAQRYQGQQKQQQGWHTLGYNHLDATGYDISAAQRRHGHVAAKIISDKRAAQQKTNTIPKGLGANVGAFSLSLDGASILERRKRMDKTKNDVKKDSKLHNSSLHVAT
ncbi:MAPK-activated protein kinase Srk1 [Malassezia pachydermatis]